MSEGFLANNAQERNLSSTFPDCLRKTPAIGVLEAGTVLVSTRKDSFDLARCCRSENQTIGCLWSVADAFRSKVRGG